VATLKQKLDHTLFGFLQTTSILHTTTTIVFQLLYESTPPKIFAKFKNYSFSAITTNTLCAPFHQLHTCYKPVGFCLNLLAQVITHTLHNPLDQAMPLHHCSKDQNDQCQAMPL
jgi:hypothetical protein